MRASLAWCVPGCYDNKRGCNRTIRLQPRKLGRIDGAPCLEGGSLLFFYRRSLMALLSASYPGLLSRANMLRLYASTPGWLKGFTPSM